MDAEAMAVVADVSQPLMFMMKGADKEAASDTLASFTDNPFIPVTREEVAQIMERIKEITY